MWREVANTCPTTTLGNKSILRLDPTNDPTNAPQVEVGAILGIEQPHVLALTRYRSGNFSVERLLDFLIEKRETKETCLCLFAVFVYLLVSKRYFAVERKRSIIKEAKLDTVNGQSVNDASTT